MTLAMGGDPTRVTGRRIVGYLFDSLIDALVLAALITQLKIDVAQAPTAGIIRPAEDTAASEVGLLLVIFGIYYLVTRVVMLGWIGATPGMLITAVRCVRWDGRPCGVVRALIRTVVMGVGSYVIGSMFLVLSAFVMWNSKGHKAISDWAGGTYVIDNIFKGRLIIETVDGLSVGPPSVTREEAEAFLRTQAEEKGIPGAFVAPLSRQAKNGEPFLDKNLDTYVVWNHKQNAWLAFDKASGAWNQIS